MKLIVTS